MKKIVTILLIGLCLSATTSVMGNPSYENVKKEAIPKIVQDEITLNIYATPAFEPVVIMPTENLGFNSFVVVKYATIKNDMVNKIYLENLNIKQCRRDSKTSTIVFKNFQYRWLSENPRC